MGRFKTRIHRRRDDLRTLRELLNATEHVLDRWADADEQGRNNLWRYLHGCSDDVAERYGNRIERLNRRGYRQWKRSLPRDERRALKADDQ